MVSRRLLQWVALLALFLLLMGARNSVGETGTPGLGLTYRSVTVPGSGVAHLLTVDLKEAELRVLDSRDLNEKALTARQFQERTGATAVVNGPFFDVDGSPMGLLVVDGEPREGLRKVDWGVFAIDAQGASIVHTADWKEREGVQQALQVGPRLVVDGEAVSLKRQAARRTALCVLPDGRLNVLVAGSPLWAADLAGFLEQQGCVDALNLDGGPSSQLYLSRSGIVVDEPGSSPVPVAVGIFVKGDAEIVRPRGCGCQ